MKRLLCLRHLVPVLGCVAALAASGCLWGVVKDVDTDEPVSGALVSFSDGVGITNSTTTNSAGYYSFDIDNGPVPLVSPLSIEVAAPGYCHGILTGRAVEYKDNLTPNPNDLSTRWQIEDFDMYPCSVEVRTVLVDIERALLAPYGGTTGYKVGLRVYDRFFPANEPCSVESGWYTIDSADPAPQSLLLDCEVPAGWVEVRVDVTLRRQWTELTHPGTNVQEDKSTTGFNWETFSVGSDWYDLTIDSDDYFPADPDDPDLEFTAQVEYRGLTP